MDFLKNITLQQQAEIAEKQFTETESQLSKIEGSFVARAQGKTKGKLVGAVFGTLLWIVACGAAAGYTVGMNELMRGICLGVVIVLLVFMLLDEFVGFSYYGKILSYKDKILQLKSRINMGKVSIRSNQDAFMGTRSAGWDYPLAAGKSIPEEAASLENSINGMETLKGGFINGVKNFLYYVAAIAITVVGSYSLFGVAAGIMDGLVSGALDEHVNGGTARTLCIVGLVAAVIIEIVLAKLAWSASDCRVTNKNMFVLVAAPLVFLAVILVGTLIFVAAMWAIAIVLAILGIVVVGATVWGITSGG